MKLVPGTLYFISEVDVLTGQNYDYYKIGLVKESRQGDSFDRAGEHQTGNPRQLVVRHTVESPAINHLETLMHDLYATERIQGEWFVLPGNSVKKVLRNAQELVGEQSDLLNAATAADQFAETASNDEILPATTEASALFLSLQQAKFEQKEIKKVMATGKAFLLGLSESKFDTTSYFTTTRKTLPKLQEDELLLKYPDIYNQFVRETMVVSGSFTSSTPRDLALTLPKKLKVSLAEQSARIENAGKRPSEATVQEIHFHHLEFLGFSGSCTWREDQSSTHLKSLIKAASGIAGIATWNRKAKTTPKFVGAEFKKLYPDLAQELTIINETSSSAVVPMRRYVWPH